MQVVVDNEVVGTQLLEKGKLQKRVTIIPLNKIQRGTIPADRLNKAKSLAPGRVELALSLIGYDKDVQAALEFVFGNTVICADKDAAKAATFEAKLRSVTVEGDVYEPSGTLTGGSAPSSKYVSFFPRPNIICKFYNVQFQLHASPTPGAPHSARGVEQA